MATYVSRHWKVPEWDCLGRQDNAYAYTDPDTGMLATDNESTANLFRILDLLRDWNPKWRINTTKAGYKSGYRTIEVNRQVGGEPNSFHTRGCAADICIGGQDDTDSALADTVMDAAEAWGLEDVLGIGFYGDWIHIDTRGYSARW